MDTPPSGMPPPVLNFGSFTPTELQTRLDAAKEEYFTRMTTGRVKGGGSSAQNYQMDVMTTDHLVLLINGLTAALGLDFSDTLRARPNFNTSRGRCDPYRGEVGLTSS